MKQLLKTIIPARIQILLFALMAIAVGTQAQTRENILVLKDFTGGINRTVSVPIYMTNSDEVIAVQFDITLPFSLVQNGTPRISTRANGHSANVHTVTSAATTYRVVVMTTENRPLNGNQGLLLSLPMAAQDDGQMSHLIRITNVVLTDKKGHNIATNNTAECTYTVSREDLPDLAVHDVSLSPATLTPGGRVIIGYVARNEGNGPTRAGWTERYYLESTVSGLRCFLGTAAYTGILGKGESLSRSQEFSIPASPHIDGEVKAVVEMVPNSNTGELVVDNWNNTNYSQTTATLSKLLRLAYNKTQLYESRYYYYYRTYDYIQMTLTRTGDWSRSESFTVGCDVSNLLRVGNVTMPATVTIPAGSEGVTFRVYCVDDGIVRPRQCTVTIPAAHGYEQQSVAITRIDDDKNPLTLSVSNSELHEGQQVVITATRGGELTDDLRLDLNCSAPYRFSVPRVIEIPAGHTSGSVTLTAYADGTPQLDTNVTFTATAADYQRATATLRLVDDDRPAISAVCSPVVVAENSGEGASTLIISRDRSINQAAKVRVTCNSHEVRLKSATVVIPTGEMRVEVPISITDNSNVDGQRTALLTTQLYVEGNSQYAPSGDRAYATAQLQVNDDEAPYITLASRVSSIAEGASATITVRRYTESANGSLLVRLASSDASVSVPATVTIPSGSYSATFTVSAAKNQTEGDDRQVTLTATTQSLGNAELTLRVTDRTLPDAVSLAVDCDGQEFYSGVPTTLYAEIGNEGTAILPAGMRIDFFLATASSLGRYVHSIPVTTVYTERELPIGDVQTLKFTANMPEVIGTYWLYARVNGDGRIPEFTTSNNVSRHFKKLFVAAPFSVESIQTDRESYLPGQLVLVTGRVSGRLNGQTVRVMLKGSGQRSYSDTKVGADGSFRTQVTIDRSAAGVMKVMALAIGQTDSPKSVSINVWNMMLTADNNYWRLNENYPRSGHLTLLNTSGKTITGITLTHTTLPDGCQLSLGDVPQSLAAGASANISYTVMPTRSMTTSQQFMLTAKCAEGAVANLQVNYVCRATYASLALSPSSINTTLLQGASRQFGVRLSNYGLQATGEINVSVPSTVPWLKSLSGRRLPSLAPGASTTLYLQATHLSNMFVSQSYSATVLLTPQNGTPRLFNLTVRIVPRDDRGEPTEPSQIEIALDDVFSKSGKGYDHLNGASIKVTNAKDGKVMAIGTAGSNGRWTANGLGYGTYWIEASASRHQTVKRQVTIGPSEKLTTVLYLPYKAVLTNFIAGTNMETGEYELTSEVDIDYTAPQSIVIPTLPESADLVCNDTIFPMKITNVGSRPAVNMAIALPTVPGVVLRQASALPAVLYPQESWVVDIAYSGSSDRLHRSIATMLMSYGFGISGENYSEDDLYQMLMGCGDGTTIPIVPPVPKPAPYPTPTPGPDPEPWPIPEDTVVVIPETVDGTWIPLPSTNSYFRLTFTDSLNEVPVGQPVDALLEVKNGQEGTFDALTFSHTASGCYTYEDSTFVFSMTEGDYTGFVKSSDGYRLAGHSDGTLKLQYIPLDEAAAEGLRAYLVSGQLAYINRAKQIRSAAQAPASKLTVVPNGKLAVTYFVQRHFLADDVDTDDIEATEPAQMAVMVRNEGKSSLTDVTVSSTQPRVVANASGAEVGYETLYSEQVDSGNSQSPSSQVFAEVAVDSIAPGSLSLRRFIYGSSESAHVASLNIETHYTAKAALRVEGVKELVRTVKNTAASSLTLTDTDGGTLQPVDLEYKVQVQAGGNLFLVNEVDDEQGAPDMAYPADGSEEMAVANVSDGCSVSGSSGNYTLTVAANGAGWVYGRLHDPTNGKMMLTRVVRQSDQAVMDPANFWQTDRRELSDYSMSYENNLHFADSLNSATESYQLFYSQKPGTPSEVMQIRLYASDGTEVSNGETTTKTVVKAVVEFTKPMRRLTYNRFTIVGGNTAYRSDSCKVESADNGATFTIDMSSLEVIPGQHYIEVDAAGLRDVDGSYGKGTARIDWTENVSKRSVIELLVGPDSAYGTIDRQTGEYDTGKLTLKATPAEGYRFDQWQQGGHTIARTAVIEYEVTGAATLKAVFVPIDCGIVVDCDTEQGTITGFASGTYSYGDELLLSAVAHEGYVLQHWLCDGEVFSTATALRVLANGSHTYTAVFVAETSGVRDVGAKSALDDTIWYTLQGLPIGQKPPKQPGIYIHCGRTVVVKR